MAGGDPAERDQAREADLAIVAAALTRLGAVELRILAMLAQRLCQGQSQYGPFDLATDSRNMRREANHELMDGLVYDCAVRLLGDEGRSPCHKAVYISEVGWRACCREADHGQPCAPYFGKEDYSTEPQYCFLCRQRHDVGNPCAPRKQCLGVGVRLTGEEVTCDKRDGHAGVCFPNDLL